MKSLLKIHSYTLINKRVKANGISCNLSPLYLSAGVVDTVTGHSQF